MAKFHFVEDYEKHVAALVKQHGLDAGMALAVGGSYELIGNIEASILTALGLRDGMKLADVGCGSGRASTVLGRRLRIEYDGFDIVQQLLDYAATKSPANYRFILNRYIRLPGPPNTYDMACAFSLFTHLLHEESFVYISDIFRVLRPGGKLVFSFLEFAMPGHWPIFEGMVEGAKHSSHPHLNMFMERNVIRLMADKIGFAEPSFYDATDAIAPEGPLDQSVALLLKPL